MKKVVNDLVGYKNLKIVQCSKYFNFSLDSVLIPNFCVLNKNINKIIDVGAGNCPISMILTQKTDSEILAVEIQKEIFELGKETLKINKLEDRINYVNEDIKKLAKKLPTDSYDLIISNPPYFKIFDKTLQNDNEIKSIARHEIKLNIEELIQISRKLLKNGGSLVFIHRTERFAEILNIMESNNIEPKRIRFVYPKVGEESNMVLIDGKKNGKTGLKVLEPLITHNSDGSYTDEILKMFS